MPMNTENTVRTDFRYFKIAVRISNDQLSTSWNLLSKIKYIINHKHQLRKNNKIRRFPNVYKYLKTSQNISKITWYFVLLKFIDKNWKYRVSAISTFWMTSKLPKLFEENRYFSFIINRYLISSKFDF